MPAVSCLRRTWLWIDGKQQIQSGQMRSTIPNRPDCSMAMDGGPTVAYMAVDGGPTVACMAIDEWADCSMAIDKWADLEKS